MHLINIKALKKSHSENTFADKDLLPYMLFYIGVSALVFEIMPHTIEEEVTVWSYALSIISVLLSVLGTVYAYQCNGGRGGEHFADKYFSIGFVVFIRMLPWLLPIFLVLMLYWNTSFGAQEYIPTTFLEVVLFSVWLVMFYYRLGKHISDIRASKELETATE